jgi:hypothetical protein
MTTTLRLLLHDVNYSDGIQRFGKDCWGASLWSAIGFGTPVRVSDAAGNLLAKATLDQGRWIGSGECRFRAQITVSGGQSTYVIQVDDQGTYTYSPKQMQAGPQMTLAK